MAAQETENTRLERHSIVNFGGEMVRALLRRAQPGFPPVQLGYTQTHPIFSIDRAVKHMQKLGILKEITGEQRDRLYAFAEYLAILNEGTEALGEDARVGERLARWRSRSVGTRDRL